MKVILKNKELEAVQVVGDSFYMNGASREGLTFYFEKGKSSLDELNEAFSDAENTSKIKLAQDGNEYLHEDYSIKVGVGTENVVVKKADSNSQEVSEERIFVKLAQLTFTEKQMASYQAQIDELKKLVEK